MSDITCFWVEKDGNVWIRRDTGQIMPYPSAFGNGAMWSSDSSYVGACRADGLWKDYPDGIALSVMTPGGEWNVDGPSYPGEGQPARPCPWTRTGDPRQPETLFVEPSINFTGRYHAHLKGGRLIPTA